MHNFSRVFFFSLNKQIKVLRTLKLKRHPPQAPCCMKKWANQSWLFLGFRKEKKKKTKTDRFEKMFESYLDGKKGTRMNAKE